MQDTLQTDILVIGSGLGGLAAAWDAAKRGCKVTLLTRASNPQESNTDLAQGGIIYRAKGGIPRTTCCRHPLGWRRPELRRRRPPAEP
jgi:succinate dehydrogenase/fumarate reductase flavoprotein subunit